jgi:tetratricopeptide (TPR) repeat protein
MLSWYRFFLLIATILIAVPAYPIEWNKAYERGRDRIKKGDCAEGQSLMMEALRGNPKADPRTPTYGTQSIEYFPQYYLAICAAEAGRISDAQRYLKESEGSRITSSKLAGEFQALKARVDSLAQQQQKTTTTTPTKPPQQQQQKPPEQKPPPIPQQQQPEKKPDVIPAQPQQPPDNRAAIQSALRDASSALANGRYEQARSAANRVLAMESDNREAHRILNEIVSRQASELQARERLQDIKEVEQVIRRGDFETAARMANDLKAKYPSESRVQDLFDQIEARRTELSQESQTDAIRKSAEREVLTAYYRGEYDQAIRLATQNISKVPKSWNLHFFLGCSYAALSMLEEKDTEERLRLARQSFRRARSIATNSSLPPFISPKILDIYKSS